MKNLNFLNCRSSFVINNVWQRCHLFCKKEATGLCFLRELWKNLRNSRAKNRPIPTGIHNRGTLKQRHRMREIVHLQAGQCGNQIGAKVTLPRFLFSRIRFDIVNFLPKQFSCKIVYFIISSILSE